MVEMYPDNNILTYLKWRGDVDFSTSPFNDIDALVLSIFSYLELPDIVDSGSKTITLEKAAKIYFTADHERTDAKQYQDLFKLMAKADRFKDAELSYFVSTLTEHTQFSAIKIALTDGTNFIAFRGTDDSLIGWKEDFEISFKVTIAQRQAVKLLERILNADNEDYYLGGHSKGGNLAEYAAINMEPKLRKRIKRIYTFDSPGIAEEVGAQLPRKYLQNTLRRFVPEFSVIGRLFEPEGINPTIVNSTRKNLSQHDAYSWQIIGSNFDTKRHRNPQSRVYNQLINQWIGNATLKERESLTNDLFSALGAGGATKINELVNNGFGGFGDTGAARFSVTTAPDVPYLLLYAVSRKRPPPELPTLKREPKPRKPPDSCTFTSSSSDIGLSTYRLSISFTKRLGEFCSCFPLRILVAANDRFTATFALVRAT